MLRRCPQEATDSDVLQRIRADVNAARRRNILYNVAETDVVSCVRAVEPPRRRAGEKKAQKAAPHGTSRFIVVRGAALKEYLMRDAQIVMPARAQWSARDRRPPPLVDLTFKESGRRQSEGKDEATETLLDVCKLQVRQRWPVCVPAGAPGAALAWFYMEITPPTQVAPACRSWTAWRTRTTRRSR